MAAAKRAPRAEQAAKPGARPINQHRGETTILLDGKPYALALTMNALVEIEEAAGVPLSQLGTALTAPSVRLIRSMIAALVRGGGADLSDEEVGRSRFDLVATTAAIQQSFQAAGVFSEGGEPTDPN